jgi:hypothetical protein
MRWHTPASFDLCTKIAAAAGPAAYRGLALCCLAGCSLDWLFPFNRHQLHMKLSLIPVS